MALVLGAWHILLDPPIGRNDTSAMNPPRYLAGALDEVYLYDGLLSENEIQVLYHLLD